MQHSEFEEYVSAVRWKTAKRPDHAYHVVSWEPEFRNTFYAFCQFIRDNGYPLRHWRRDYLCYNIGEYKYWTMYWPAPDKVDIPGHERHYPLSETILINRNRIDGTGA
jgi:hypothetical protein